MFDFSVDSARCMVQLKENSCAVFPTVALKPTEPVEVYTCEVEVALCSFSSSGQALIVDHSPKVRLFGSHGPVVVEHSPRVITATSVAPDGRYVVVAEEHSDEPVLTIYTLSSGRTVACLEKNAWRVSVDKNAATACVALVGVENQVVCGETDGSLLFWANGSHSKEEESLRMLAHASPVVAVVGSTEGKILISAESAGVIKFWSLPMMKVYAKASHQRFMKRGTFLVPGRTVLFSYLPMAGRLLIVSALMVGDRELFIYQLWDPEKPELLLDFVSPALPLEDFRVLFSPDGRYFLATKRTQVVRSPKIHDIKAADCELQMFSCLRGSFVAALPGAFIQDAFAFSEDGERVAAHSRKERGLIVFHRRSPHPRTVCKYPPNFHRTAGVSLCADNRSVLAWSDTASLAAVYQPPNTKPIMVLSGAGVFEQGCMSADGLLAVLIDRMRIVQVYSVVTGEKRGFVSLHGSIHLCKMQFTGVTEISMYAAGGQVVGKFNPKSMSFEASNDGEEGILESAVSSLSLGIGKKLNTLTVDIRHDTVFFFDGKGWQVGSYASDTVIEDVFECSPNRFVVREQGNTFRFLRVKT